MNVNELWNSYHESWQHMCIANSFFFAIKIWGYQITRYVKADNNGRWLKVFIWPMQKVCPVKHTNYAIQYTWLLTQMGTWLQKYNHSWEKLLMFWHCEMDIYINIAAVVSADKNIRYCQSFVIASCGALFFGACGSSPSCICVCVCIFICISAYTRNKLAMNKLRIKYM